MNYDPKKDIQRVRLGGEVFVFVREAIYEKLLRKLESMDTALQLQRTRAETSLNIADVLLRGGLGTDQVKLVLQAPTFGRRLQLLRQFRNLGQSELAAKSGLDQSTISKLENDQVKRPSYEVIQKLFDTLDLPDIASYAVMRKEAAHAGRGRELVHA